MNVHLAAHKFKGKERKAVVAAPGGIPGKGYSSDKQRRNEMSSMSRRKFLQTGAGLAAALPLSAGLHSPQAAVAGEPASKIVGIQIGAVSFVDEGIEACLDTLQEKGGVNTIIPVVFSYSNTTAGRHKPYPGHGNPQGTMDVDGGNFAKVHTSYYHDTGIEPAATQAPDHPGFDVLGDVIPHTRKRGMKVIGMLHHNFSSQLPGIDKLKEKDFNGEPARGGRSLCMNNPYLRNFMAGLVDDLLHSYDLDGLMYVNETQGAFANILGARQRGRTMGAPGTRTCFCEYCQAKAKEMGIRMNRVVPAFEELSSFVTAARARKRPVDGYYVSLWRLMLRYPELLQWEHLYHESKRETYRLLYQQTKAARPGALFGIHLWSNTFMSPIYRAEQDFSELSKYADFLKLSLYNHCAGPRLASYVQSVSETIYGDIPADELMQFHYDVLGYPNESPYEEVSATGLGPDFVYRESKRALDGRGQHGAKILAGIDVDIPVVDSDIIDGFDAGRAVRGSRASIREATKEALRAGVDGLVISRKYAEMNLDNMSGVGDALRESGSRE